LPPTGAAIAAQPRRPSVALRKRSRKVIIEPLTLVFDLASAAASRE
jgi:hypothetical protein